MKVFTLPKGTKRPETKGSRYYVDGYTDIAGKFRYALTDIQLIEEFALLAITEVGAVVRYATPPRVKTEDKTKRNLFESSDESDADSSLE